MPSYTLVSLRVENVVWDGTDESLDAIATLITGDPAAPCDMAGCGEQACPIVPPQPWLNLPAIILTPERFGCIVVRIERLGVLILSRAAWSHFDREEPARSPGVQHILAPMTDAHTSYAEQPCTIGCFLATRTVWP